MLYLFMFLKYIVTNLFLSNYKLVLFDFFRKFQGNEWVIFSMKVKFEFKLDICINSIYLVNSINIKGIKYCGFFLN